MQRFNLPERWECALPLFFTQPGPYFVQTDFSRQFIHKNRELNVKCMAQELTGSLWLLGGGSSVTVVGAGEGSPVVEPGLPGGGDGSAWSSSK